jgi:hypothetical protein
MLNPPPSADIVRVLRAAFGQEAVANKERVPSKSVHLDERCFSSCPRCIDSD